MARCPHEQIVVIEYALASTVHHREVIDGTPVWTHNSDFDDYSGAIEVQCKQCGLRRQYGQRLRRPKWLAARLQEIGI